MIIRYALIMVGGDLGCCPRGTRQLRKERVHPIRVEAEIRWELPQDRTQLLIEGEHARGEEVRQRRLDAAQFLHVRDETPALHGKDEVLRDRGRPSLEAGPALQGVEAAVDLNGVHALGHISQLFAMRQPRRIELPSPGWVGPARNADPNRHSRMPYRAKIGVSAATPPSLGKSSPWIPISRAPATLPS